MDVDQQDYLGVLLGDPASFGSEAGSSALAAGPADGGVCSHSITRQSVSESLSRFRILTSSLHHFAHFFQTVHYRMSDMLTRGCIHECKPVLTTSQGSNKTATLCACFRSKVCTGTHNHQATSAVCNGVLKPLAAVTVHALRSILLHWRRSTKSTDSAVVHIPDQGCHARLW